MIPLPTPVAGYFALSANASLAELGRVFAEDAVVRDERHAHRGLDAIHDWRVDTMARTPFQARPLGAEERDGTVTVSAEVSGAFPGSPIVLDHRFSLSGGRITALEIG